jgi:hypothetical protein
VHHCGQGEVERGATIAFCVCPYAAAVLLDDLPANGKADAGAGDPTVVNSFEQTEDSHDVFGGESADHCP